MDKKINLDSDLSSSIDKNNEQLLTDLLRGTEEVLTLDNLKSKLKLKNCSNPIYVFCNLRTFLC